MRWYYLTGGVLGVIFVSTLLVTVRTLGASGILAATLVGQMSASVVIDRFGLFGVERTVVTLGEAGRHPAGRGRRLARRSAVALPVSDQRSRW